MATRTIKQTAVIKGATPADVYGTLMSSTKHGALSGQPAKVSTRVGGKWSVGHDLEGKQLKLTKDKRIVQTHEDHVHADGRSERGLQGDQHRLEGVLLEPTA